VPFRLVPPSGEVLPRIRSVPCSMCFTGRPRPILGDGSTRYETRSSAETSCGGRGLRCAATVARLALTASPWRWWRCTGWVGSLTNSPRSCGRAGIGRHRPGGCSSRNRAVVSSGRCRSRQSGTGSCRRPARSCSSLSSRPTCWTVHSVSDRDGPRTTPCRCSSVRVGRVGGGWWKRISPHVWMWHHTAPWSDVVVKTGRLWGGNPYS
jgi:hypothetical protein